jgi:phytoene dehydrogenase-like protein
MKYLNALAEKITELGGEIFTSTAVQPMRDELVAYGFDELRTPEEVDKTISNSEGTVFLM